MITICLYLSILPTYHSSQAAIIAQLAEERAAAARQQANAERAVDAARGAELAAAKLLADLQAQVCFYACTNSGWTMICIALLGLASTNKTVV